VTPRAETRGEGPAPQAGSGRRRLTGVLAPVLTPFRADLTPDAPAFLRHSRWLLAHGCAGLLVFGTTSEANSMSVEERESLLWTLVEQGVDPGALMPGTGACALTDSVRLTRAAVRAGASGVLMLPPFYYKDVREDGLFRSFAEVIERVGDSALRVYLYHIPQVSGVPISLSLIERLLTAYPVTLAGMKDSSGSFANTRAVLDAFGRGFDVFVGSEELLLQNLRGGGVGCISATANVNPGAIDELFRRFEDERAPALQQKLDAVRLAFQKHPLIPALKHCLAHSRSEQAWRTVRPPHLSLDPARGDELVRELEALGFTMPGLA
jgi:4-hydroxy-tetrahydrodipicolinate synthase